MNNNYKTGNKMIDKVLLFYDKHPFAFLGITAIMIITYILILTII